MIQERLVFSSSFLRRSFSFSLSISSFPDDLFPRDCSIPLRYFSCSSHFSIFFASVSPIAMSNNKAKRGVVIKAMKTQKAPLRPRIVAASAIYDIMIIIIPIMNTNENIRMPTVKAKVFDANKQLNKFIKIDFYSRTSVPQSPIIKRSVALIHFPNWG